MRIPCLLPWLGISFYWTLYKAVNYESKFLQEEVFSCYGYFPSEGVSWLRQKKEMVGNVCCVLKDSFVFNYHCCRIHRELFASVFFLAQIKFSAFQHIFFSSAAFSYLNCYLLLLYYLSHSYMKISMLNGENTPKEFNFILKVTSPSWTIYLQTMRNCFSAPTHPPPPSLSLLLSFDPARGKLVFC